MMATNLLHFTQDSLSALYRGASYYLLWWINCLHATTIVFTARIIWWLICLALYARKPERTLPRSFLLRLHTVRPIISKCILGAAKTHKWTDQRFSFYRNERQQWSNAVLRRTTDNILCTCTGLYTRAERGKEPKGCEFRQATFIYTVPYISHMYGTHYHL